MSKDWQNFFIVIFIAASYPLTIILVFRVLINHEASDETRMIAGLVLWFGSLQSRYFCILFGADIGPQLLQAPHQAILHEVLHIPA
jgi:hypothetical protein